MNLLATTVDSIRSPIREHRRVRGLRWVELRPDGPFKRPKPRRTCVKRGVAFERRVGKALKRALTSSNLDGELVSEQWFLFADQDGVNWAQTDHYLITEERILLMECKLTQTDSATPQLLSLYLPLLHSI